MNKVVTLSLLDLSNIPKANLANNIITGVFIDEQNRIVFERKDNGNIVIGRDVTDGVGIASADLNESNQIVIVLTNGEQFNLGGSGGGGGVFNGILGTGYLKEINGLTLKFVPISAVGNAALVEYPSSFTLDITGAGSGGGMNFKNLVQVIERQSDPTVSGTAGAWIPRGCRHTEFNTLGAEVDSSGYITLPAGNYYMTARATYLSGNGVTHAFRLYSPNDAAVLALMSGYGTATNMSNTTAVSASFSLTTSSLVRFEQMANAAWNNSMVASTAVSLRLQIYKV